MAKKSSSKGKLNSIKPDNSPYVSSKARKKQPGISNSGGQFSNQTDNKQVTINKGQQNPLVQGKKKAAKLPSQSGPKKK